MSIKTVDLVVGKTYEVTISDCCVAGSFVSKLLEKVDGEDWKVVFENGVTLAQAYDHAVKFIEVS